MNSNNYGRKSDNHDDYDDEIECLRGKKDTIKPKNDEETISIEDSFDENVSKDRLNGSNSVSREADDEIESDDDEIKRTRHRKGTRTDSDDDDDDDDVKIIESDEDEKDDDNDDDDDDDDDEDDENKPSGAECLSRCKQFAEITGTDNALAMFYLQDTKWDLERALNVFYQHTGKANSTSNSASGKNSKKIVACFDIDRLNRDEQRHAAKNEQKQQQNQPTKKRQSDEDDTTGPTISTTSKRSSSPKKSKLGESTEQVVGNDQNPNKQDNEKKNYFKILSWNIDGLDKSSLESRALGVAAKIQSEKPDIVLLQEVVVANEKILRDNLGSEYEFSSGNTVFLSEKSKYSSASSSSSSSSSTSVDDRKRDSLLASLAEAAATSSLFNEQAQLADDACANISINDFYYTTILTKKATCTIKSRTVKPFANSLMNRNLLEVNLLYKNRVHICAMTAHLESTKDFSKQRVEQLRYCLKSMLEQNENYLVFFGGDLNLRDSELNSIGGLPKGIYDLWESTGSRKECLYTWDCLRNSNLKMNAKFKPRCRFDRLFFKQPSCSQQVVVAAAGQQTDRSKSNKIDVANDVKLTLTPVYFELEGLEKLKSCGRFCSDHWAIQSYCQLQIDNSV